MEEDEKRRGSGAPPLRDFLTHCSQTAPSVEIQNCVLSVWPDGARAGLCARRVSTAEAVNAKSLVCGSGSTAL